MGVLGQFWVHFFPPNFENSLFYHTESKKCSRRRSGISFWLAIRPNNNLNFFSNRNHVQMIVGLILDVVMLVHQSKSPVTLQFLQYFSQFFIHYPILVWKIIHVIIFLYIGIELVSKIGIVEGAYLAIHNGSIFMTVEDGVEVLSFKVWITSINLYIIFSFCKG